MVFLNIFLPIFSFLFIFTVLYSPSLNICLGKDYLNFFSTKVRFFPEDNPYIYYISFGWMFILTIGNLKFQINTLLKVSY